jgi:DNA-binding response OmpR family regulator
MILNCPRCGQRMEIASEIREDEVFTCAGCGSSWRARRRKEVRRTAWVADPPRPFRDFLVRELEELGFAVRTFEDGTAVLRALAEAPPSLMITNVILPGLLGVDLCERIKNGAVAVPIPVILLGAIHKVERYHRRPRFLYGADEYIEEGISSEVFRGIVGRLTGLHTQAGPYRTPDQEQQYRKARLFLSRFVEERASAVQGYLVSRDREALRALVSEGEALLERETPPIPAELFRSFLLQYLKSKMGGQFHG